MNTPKIRFKGFEDDWEQRKLGDIVDVRSGKDYKHLSEGNIPVYGTGGYMLSVNQALSYDEDAIGIGRKGTIDKPYILKAPFWTVDTLFYAVPSQNSDLDFVFDIFQNIDWKKKDESTGVPSLSKTAINEIDISAPCLEEQQVIGSYFSKIDHLIALHQCKCDETKELKKFMLQKMFPKNGEKNPEIRFEGFTDDWEQRKLGEVCEIKDSARIPNSEWSESGVPYIRASDVTNENTDGVLFISQERYEFYKNRTGAPTKDDVLFNGGGEIGKSLLITDEKPIYVQGGAVLYAQTSKSRELVGQYLKTYFETTNAKSYIDAASAGGTMRHFTLKPSQIMRILMPSVEEQEKIGEYFANLDQLITLHQRKCEKLKELKKFMLQNMFV